MRFQLAVLSFAAATATRSIARATTGANNTASAFVVNHSGDIRQASSASIPKARNTPLATSSSSDNNSGETDPPKSVMTIDPEYPGTAVERMLAVRERVKGLGPNDLNGPWEEVRRKILWAGGLKDLPRSVPGQGYTGHSFNDYNHVDLTCMRDEQSDNENDGRVRGIAIGNQLGPGIRVASLTELGPGGSWSTCAMGCNKDPPQDVAHVQFRARIAFKLVWVPNANYDSFVLVDDDGAELARGQPTGQLPSSRERQVNYQLVAGSKYARVVDEIAGLASTTQSSTIPNLKMSATTVKTSG